jgi:glycosyltransferase involved in cell wall biosynthesis
MPSQHLAVAVIMDGIDDEGGQHGQAVRIAVEMARLGHRVCYLSRWPVSRRRARVTMLLEAGVDVLTPRWVDHRPHRLRPTPDDRARLRRLLTAAWRDRALPSRELLLSPAVRERAGHDFGRIAGDMLRRWRERRASDLPLVVHVISRRSAPLLPELRTLRAPIIFSEFGRLELYGLDVDSAPRLDVDAYTTDSPDSAGELEAIEQRSVLVIPCIAGFEDPISDVPDLAERFVVANRLVDYKRTDVAIRAVASGGWELDVYGGGPDEGALLALVAELNAEHLVHMHGLADPATVRVGLDASHAFISCSHLDGTPMSVLEAMSQGRAIVAYSIPGIKTLVDDGVEGLYFDGSPPGLVSKLSRLAHEPCLAANLGRAARLRWEREFAPSALVARYEEVYRIALDKRSP